MPIIGDIQYLHEIYKTVEICHILLLKQEIQFLIYVKNMLIVGQRPERLSAIFQSVVYRLQRLGFFIKLGIPVAKVPGFLDQLKVQAVPNKKIQNQQIECKSAHQNRWLTIKEL